MKLALVFPPLADPTQPYSSLPALAAFVRRTGWCEVLPIDANVEYVRSVLTGDGLRAAGERVERRLARLSAGAPPRGRRRAEYAGLLGASLKAPQVAAEIDAAVAALGRRETFRDLARLSEAKRRVAEAMEVLAAACHPPGAPLAASAREVAWPAKVTAWAADRQRNPFRAFFEASVLPRLERAAPGAVGVSVTYRGQVVPAVTLALLVRERLPGVPVVFGGSMVSRWADALPDTPEVFDWCDYLIPFEGETPLVALLAALERGGGFDEVPNLLWRRSGALRSNPAGWEDVDALPTPDHEGLPLGLYLAPEPVFLLAASRGCYWRRCAFCSVSPATGLHYRARRAELVRRDLATLAERHGARCVSFADDCVAPRTLRALADLLRRDGPAISWQCEVRFEKALSYELLAGLREAGCRNLIFGLESYSPRVLEAMGKGVRHAEIERILGDCRRAGLAFNLQFFFGFPGETAAEAETTAAFVRRQMAGAATFSFGVFELQKGAEIERRPGAFGIRRVTPDGPLGVRFDYRPEPAHAEGMRTTLAREIAARTRHRHAGLSINAHTLLFLHEAGEAALAAGLYDLPRNPRGRRAPGRLMGRPLVAGRHQRVAALAHPGALADGSPDGASDGAAALLYDHDLDRTVELSRLALWVLVRLDGRTTPAELAEELRRAVGDEGEAARAAIEAVVTGLSTRGFLVPSREPGRRGGTRAVATDNQFD